MRDDRSEKSGAPRVAWRQCGGEECLWFTFGPELSGEDALGAILEWRRAFARRPGRWVVVWDASRMVGYDSEARRAWQRALRELGGQISHVWLITESKLVKMGAAVMGALTGLDIRVVASASAIARSAIARSERR